MNVKKLTIYVAFLMGIFVFISCGSKEAVEEKPKSQPQAVETGTEEETPVKEDSGTDDSTRNAGVRSSGYNSYAGVRSSAAEEVTSAEDENAKKDAEAEKKEEPAKPEPGLFENPYVRYGAIGGLLVAILVGVFFVFKPKAN